MKRLICLVLFLCTAYSQSNKVKKSEGVGSSAGSANNCLFFCPPGNQQSGNTGNTNGQTGTGTGTSTGTEAGTGSSVNGGSTSAPNTNTGATSSNGGVSSGGSSTSRPATQGVSFHPATNSVLLPNINIDDKLNHTGECKDLVNCRVYPREKICIPGSVYRPWAQVRCKVYCSFCHDPHASPEPCLNKIPNCNEYDSDLCTNPLYRLFREDNCKLYCGLCTVTGTGATKPSSG